LTDQLPQKFAPPSCPSCPSFFHWRIISINLRTGESKVLVSQFIGDIAVSTDHRFGVGAAMLETSAASQGQSPLMRFDLESGAIQQILTHGSSVTGFALDRTHSIVATGSSDGVVRIGPSSGAEPHILLGQEGKGAIYSLSYLPDGRWVAASGEGSAIHVWPVPNLEERPFHRRPYDELLSVLRGHTNLRAVADSASSSGYRLEPGPFPGWATLPER
jgi:WD40 repeat protein